MKVYCYFLFFTLQFNDRFTLKDKAYPISLQELTACIYYKLAIDRGLRGCKTDSELLSHTKVPVHFTGESVTNFVFEREKRGYEPARAAASWEAPTEESSESIEDHSSSSDNCSRASDSDIDEAILYAPLALEFVYNPSRVDAQRLAASQGWDTIFFKETAEPEQPAFALFATSRNKSAHVAEHKSSVQPQDAFLSSELFSRYKFTSSKCRDVVSSAKEVKKIAVLAIRGTSSVHDVVTDIRAAPTEFPPKQDEIRSCLYGKNDPEDTKSSLEALQSLVDAFVKAHAYNGNRSPAAEFEVYLPPNLKLKLSCC